MSSQRSSQGPDRSGPAQPIRMTAELRDAWCAALRSGKYEQGTGRLCKDGKFCCLGVLGDLLVQRGLAKWSEGFEGSSSLEVSEADCAFHSPSSYLPDGL